MAKNSVKKPNRLLSILMIAAVLGVLLFAYLYDPTQQSVSATTTCDRATAIAYAKALVGKKWDVDNGSYDCVDLIKLYFRDVGGMALKSQGDAWRYATDNIQMPTGWTRQYIANGYTPQAGDCCAWYVSPGGNKCGHVAIVVSVKNGWITVVEQSTTLQCAAKYVDYPASSPTCYIHPDFENIVVPTTATPTTATTAAPTTTETPTTTEAPTTVAPTTAAPCKHVYNSGVVTKEATCTSTGIRVYTCTKCGVTKTETIPVTEHQFCDYQPLDDFSHRKVCSCGLTEEEAHVFDTSFVVQERSCDTDGIVVYVCSICKATKSEIIPMYGIHEFSHTTCIHCGMNLKRPRLVHSIEEYNQYQAKLKAEKEAKAEESSEEASSEISDSDVEIEESETEESTLENDPGFDAFDDFDQ